MARQDNEQMTGTKALISVREAAWQMSRSVRSVWQDVHSGELASVRIGRRVFVRPSAVDEFIERMATQTTHRKAS